MRKIHVRNEMLKLRDVYEKIFDEIEGPDSEVCIVWPSEQTSAALGHPKFQSKKQFNRMNEERTKTLANDSNLPKSIKTKQQLITKGSIMKFVPEQKAIENETIRNEASGSGSSSISTIQEKAKVNSEQNKLFNSFLSDDLERLNSLEQRNLKMMSKNDLISVRENLSLEVLWIQQAIQSRVQVK